MRAVLLFADRHRRLHRADDSGRGGERRSDGGARAPGPAAARAPAGAGAGTAARAAPAGRAAVRAAGPRRAVREFGGAGEPDPPVVVEPSKPATAAVVWLHGLGADGHDFEPSSRSSAAPGWMTCAFCSRTRRYAPSPSTGAWRCVRGTTSRDPSSTAGPTKRACGRRPESPARWWTSRWRAASPRSASCSRGSRRRRIALFAGLRLPFRVAGILALSTYLPVPGALAAEGHPANRGVPIFLAHGSQDPVIALALSERSRLRWRISDTPSRSTPIRCPTRCARRRSGTSRTGCNGCSHAGDGRPSLRASARSREDRPPRVKSHRHGGSARQARNGRVPGAGGVSGGCRGGVADDGVTPHPVWHRRTPQALHHGHAIRCRAIRGRVPGRGFGERSRDRDPGGGARGGAGARFGIVALPPLDSIHAGHSGDLLLGRDRTLFEDETATVTIVETEPGHLQPPHDHAMCAVIGVFEGGERNRFYRRTGGRARLATRRVVRPAEVIALRERTVHAISAEPGETCRALHVYLGRSAPGRGRCSTRTPVSRSRSTSTPTCTTCAPPERRCRTFRSPAVSGSPASPRPRARGR